MMTYKSISQESVEQRRTNEALAAKAAKNAADVEYLAMMADVELDSGEESEVMDDE